MLICVFTGFTSGLPLTRRLLVVGEDQVGDTLRGEQPRHRERGRDRVRAPRGVLERQRHERGAEPEVARGQLVREVGRLLITVLPFVFADRVFCQVNKEHVFHRIDPLNFYGSLTANFRQSVANEF